MKHVIKSSKRVQDYSVKKLQTSITCSLQAVHATGEVVKHIPAVVGTAVSDWLNNKHELTTKDIRNQAS